MPGFEAATHIIVLQPPLWLRQVRIIRRFLLRKAGMVAGQKETLTGLWQFLAWNRNYDRDNLARALALLDDRGITYTICKRLAEVEAVLRHG
jgi:hypothetical protein